MSDNQQLIFSLLFELFMKSLFETASCRFGITFNMIEKCLLV